MRDGERDLAAGLLSSVEPEMLVIADREFFSFELWAEFKATGAALLWWVSAHTKLPVESLLPDFLPVDHQVEEEPRELVADAAGRQLGVSGFLNDLRSS